MGKKEKVSLQMCDHLRLFSVLCNTLGLKPGTLLEPRPRALTSMQWTWRTNGNRVLSTLRLKCVLAHPGPITKGFMTHMCPIIKSSFPAWKVIWFYVTWMEEDYCIGFGCSKGRVRGELWDPSMCFDLAHWLLVITFLESLLEVVIFDDIN